MRGSTGEPTARWGAPPDRRTHASDWLRLHGLPSTKDEWWRYADLDAALRSDFVPAARPPTAELDGGEIDRVAGRHGGPRLVFVDGTFMGSLSSQPGSWCSSQTHAAGTRLGGGRPSSGAPSFHRYDGAGHAFFSVDRPAYRPEAAVDGWQRIFDWYGRYLAGG